MRARKLALDAMLGAMCAVLGCLAIDTGNVKITLESLPILLGALLLGPADGAAVGLVGTAVYQLLRYGVSVTTPLWIAPYVLAGWAVGYAARKKRFSLRPAETAALVTGAEVFITLFNTVTIYIDSRLFGYYFPGFVTGSLAIRAAVCAGKSAAFSLLLPQIIRAVKGGKETMSHDV